MMRIRSLYRSPVAGRSLRSLPVAANYRQLIAVIGGGEDPRRPATGDRRSPTSGVRHVRVQFNFFPNA